ncbi:response regulator [Streptomyces sp.]|uniref:response regulator n=1 Tax=Streptomyces sp. TaxID=1931 RepID=UPI002F3E98BA
MDDNKVIRQLIRVNLELEGFEVVTAADGAECLEIVHSVRPDVVTLDVVMPRLDGVRTAARLRADPRTRQVGIVMVSAGSLPEGAGGPGGVDAYVSKPFEPGNLVDTVRTVAGRRLLLAGPTPDLAPGSGSRPDLAPGSGSRPHLAPGSDPCPHLFPGSEPRSHSASRSDSDPLPGPEPEPKGQAAAASGGA